MAQTIDYAELHSQDPRRAASFYAELFGWRTVEKELIRPPGNPAEVYTEIDTGGGVPAGLVRAPSPGGPSYWTPYVTVPRLDEALARARALGATVEAPRTTIPAGHFAILRDPAGAIFGLFERSAAAG